MILMSLTVSKGKKRPLKLDKYVICCLYTVDKEKMKGLQLGMSQQ